MKARTSQSHPLQIAEVPLGLGMGKVGLTFCPGKKQQGAFTGHWDRDLKLDLEAIASWDAAALVTLIEEHEFAMLGVDGLGEAARDHHMLWYHLPIRDVSVPSQSFEDAWQTVGEGLRAILRDGFNVLVHCKGGLGRAGMTAARLLIELGIDPQAAITSVREVRPGAIETPAQVQYVRQLTTIMEPAQEATREAQEDRALGAMMGLAVGDAVGTTYEFQARDRNPRLVDMVGGGPFRLKPGEWTDDTAMALALMDSLLAQGDLDGLT
jgi:ADP-ribosyl-[dinitrogen reductase] hydrolase